MEALWKIENLFKTYEVKSESGGPERIPALDDVSLDIYRRETLGIVGESGSGKTTLGQTLIRLVEPDAGKISYRGREITGLTETQLRPLRKNFQIVFQHPYKSLNPRLAVGETIAEGVDGGRKQKPARAGELLELVGLPADKSRSYPHQFSGGQRQRIAIARALSTAPEFLVCDEPTSNLDLSIQAQMLDLFAGLKERLNLTYLFISHDLKVIEFIADRIAVMLKGRIVEIGPTEQIINHPVHPYTRLLVNSVFLKGRSANPQRPPEF